MFHLQPLARVHLQRGAEHLHLLGPRATAELLAEVAARIGGLPCILTILNEYRAAPLAAQPDAGRGAMSAATLPIIVEDWRPVSRNTLRGFCRVRLQSGMVLHDVAVHAKNGKFWVSPPSKPRLGRDGLQMTDPATGKPLWSPIVAFETKQIGDRFSAQVVEALRRAFPTALDEVGQ